MVWAQNPCGTFWVPHILRLTMLSTDSDRNFSAVKSNVAYYKYTSGALSVNTESQIQICAAPCGFYSCKEVGKRLSK